MGTVASIYDLKPRFQAIWRPATNWLAAHGVTANQITLLAAVLSLVAGGFVAWRPTAPAALLGVPAVLFIRMALNAVDGMLAREHNMKSRLGAILNEIGDVVSDAGLYLPMALVLGVSAIGVTIVTILGIISEMAGVVAIQIGADRRYDGPLGKSDRAFVFGCLYFLLGIGVEPGRWLDFLWWILAALAAATIVNRSRRALVIAAAESPGNTDGGAAK
jgi:CDP-diacylglycerol--glycerol-3-phosphate 3-phosphatidyltransferase